MKHPRDVIETDWQSLDEGDTLRIHCSSNTCRDKIGKALTITRTSTGCIYNCYRCGLVGFPGVIGISSNPTQALRRIKEIRNGRKNSSHNDNNYSISLPHDFINLIQGEQIPPQAHAWIYKYELDDDDIYKYNIGYSYKLERVILPIYNNTELMAWQGRDIYYKRNKELFKEGKIKRSPLKYYTEYNKFKYNNNKIYFKLYNNNNIYNKIIIVEDILSCIKLYNKYNKINYNVVALLNSTIHDKLIPDLELNKYKRVYIWLDWDARVKSIKASRKLQTLGINTRSIRTKLDPKAIPYKELVL
jgi:hypothetical protein